MLIELVFDADCPNVPAARTRLAAALRRLGLAPRWRELMSGSDDLPVHARGFGSPTVLVEKRDVLGAAPSGTPCCRVYPSDDGSFAGVPSIDAIVEAIARATDA